MKTIECLCLFIGVVITLGVVALLALGGCGDLSDLRPFEVPYE